MKTQAVIPCAGIGTRLKTDKNKPLVDLLGQPLFMYALKAFVSAQSIDSIILPVHADAHNYFEDIIAQTGFDKSVNVIIGGATRRESVFRGLSCADKDTDMIAVHDAARPLITPALIDEAVRQCAVKSSVILAVPVSSTIKSVTDGRVTHTLKRSELWEVQTPQVFSKIILEQAHALDMSTEATDDAMLVEIAGHDVHVIEGSYRNLKVTTNEDLMIAEAFLKKEI